MQGKVLYLHSPTPSAFCSRAPLRWIVCLGCPEAQCGLAAGNVRLSWWCCRGRGLLRMQQGVLGTVWCDQLASFWIWSTDFGSYNSLLIPLLSSFFFFFSLLDALGGRKVFSSCACSHRLKSILSFFMGPWKSVDEQPGHVSLSWFNHILSDGSM